MTYLTQQNCSPTALRTLQEATIYFAVPQNCIDYVVSLRWPDGKVTCPTCGSKAVTWLPTRSLFQCKARHSKRQFSVKVGTVLEDSPISLGKWLMVMWMMGSCRNGISSHEVGRTIGITQKSAWFMLHRLREAMQDNSTVLTGEVEMDETYMGGNPKNRHLGKRRIQARKNPIFGMVERGGKVIAAVVPDANTKTVLPIIKKHVSKDSTVYTDDFPIYDKLKSLDYDHQVITHTRDHYVKGSIHTNTIENFWSVLKRTLRGTYISVTRKHLMAYVSEQMFRFNLRRGFTEQQRGFVLLAGIVGKRLTYANLTAGIEATLA